MNPGKTVLIVSIDPELIDFSSERLARLKLTPEQVKSARGADGDRLRSLGYEVDSCVTGAGGDAERVLEEKLGRKSYDCVMIGAGVRAASFLLFEKLVNVVHAHAPQAKLCFNTRPGDMAEAVQRWV